MSKYARLPDLLEGKGTDTVRLSFSDIENFLGFELPNSARYPAWWSNNPMNSVMTKVWTEAGWKTREVDIAGEKVTFYRSSEDSRDANLSNDHFLDLHALPEVPLNVLKILAKRSGRSLSREAFHILQDALAPS